MIRWNYVNDGIQGLGLKKFFKDYLTGKKYSLKRDSMYSNLIITI